MEVCSFFFNDTATTEIYTLSLHDALPIYLRGAAREPTPARSPPPWLTLHPSPFTLHRSAATPRTWSSDRKSTRLNSSHANISYAVFCLKKNHLSACRPCTYSYPPCTASSH